MEDFPELKGRVLQLVGVDWKRSAADVVLSNIGWIAVTAGAGSIVSVKAYTPKGAGLYLREPALLPTSVRQRGMTSVFSLQLVVHMSIHKTMKYSTFCYDAVKVENGLHPDIVRLAAFTLCIMPRLRLGTGNKSLQNEAGESILILNNLFLYSFQSKENKNRNKVDLYYALKQAYPTAFDLPVVSNL